MASERSIRDNDSPYDWSTPLPTETSDNSGLLGRMKRLSFVRPESSQTMYDRSVTPVSKLSKDESLRNPASRPGSAALMASATVEEKPWVPTHPRKPFARNDSDANFGFVAASGGSTPAGDQPSPWVSGTKLTAMEKSASGQGLVSGSHLAAVEEPIRGPAGTERRSWVKRHPWWLALIFLLIVALAAGLGAGLGVGLNKSSSHSSVIAAPPHSTSSSSSAAPKPTGPPLDSSGNDPKHITPLAKWDWTNPTSKAIGVSLGNLYVLERWMDEDWWVRSAGNVSDEWSFHQTLGDKVDGILDKHMSTFITEDDVQTMYEAGVNVVRIPLAYWFFIPTAGNEPYRNGTHLEHVTQMFGWLWKRGLRVMIDMHQMPGSQSGDQASGQVTSNPTWFNSTNQDRSDQMIANLLAWLKPHPYKSVVAGICPVNEPNGPLGATSSHLETVQAFYNRTYTTLSDAGYPMFFHHAFAPNPQQYWRSWASDKDPKLLVLNDNPYPGFYPPKNQTSEILNAVCDAAQPYNTFPVPTAKTEFSLISGIYGNGTWNQAYYNAQASAYGDNGAGSFFWSYKVMNSSHPVVAGTWPGQVQWSFVTQLEMGNIRPVPKNQNAQEYLNGLPNPVCGSAPTLPWVSSN